MQPGQRFVRAQRVCFAAIAALGFGALALGDGLGPAAAAAGALSVLASLWHGRPRLPDRVWLIVQVAFLGWVGVQLVGGGHVLSVFGSLLIFVQVHRLLTRRRTRDDLYCCFIAFGQLLLASVLTVDALFFVLFMAFVFFVIQGLLLSRMALSAEAAWEAERGPLSGGSAPVRAYAALDGLVTLRLVAATTALALVIQLGTLVLFFVLPRAQAAMLSGLVSPLHVSGFSDRVRLGSVGAMQLSRDPVMRVKAWDGAGAPLPDVDRLYWHGLALDRFDGRGWELSDSRRTSLTTRGGRRANPPPTGSPWSVRAEVTLEPLDSSVLFYVARAAGIYGDFSQLEAVETDGFYVPGPSSRRTYAIYADPAPPPVEALRAQDPREAPSEFLGRYTQLPSGLSPRISELAARWSAGAATPLDQALLLQQKLATFTYSLDQAPSAFDDPLLAFLEDVQEGHCEYFASGLAVMLRTLGVPSRVVNGFAGAEWNPVGEYWVVRQLHAHSWVEVWFPEDGWVLFDPTPSRTGGVQQSARLTLLARLRAWSDVGDLTWSRIMLDYGLDTQVMGLRKGMSSLGALGAQGFGLSRLFGGPQEHREGGPRPAWGLRWLALLGGVLAAAAALWWLAGGDRSPMGRARWHAGRLEARWMRSLAPAPTDPRPTLLALARRAAASDPARFAGAPELVEAYFASRFGGEPLARQVVADLRGMAARAARWRPDRGPGIRGPARPPTGAR
jgi:transglutaminase-like putative cysteine protease